MRGRKLQVVWRDSAETLYQRFRQERHPELRQHLQALWLLRLGRTLNDVAAVLGIGRRTLQRWLRWYQDEGLAGLQQHYRGRRGKPGGARCKLTATQCEQLRQAAREAQFGTVWEAREWVEQHCGVTYSYWGLRALLFRLRLRKKVPRPLGAKADLAEQDAWKKGACKAA